MRMGKARMFASAFGTPGSSSVFLGELPLGHRQVDDAFDERDNRWNECPTEDDVQDALCGTPKVEFVNADTADEKREQASCNFALFALSSRRIRLADAAPWTDFCA